MLGIQEQGGGWCSLMGPTCRAGMGLFRMHLSPVSGTIQFPSLLQLSCLGLYLQFLDRRLSHPEVLEVMRTSGPAATGLTFIWMPQLFAKMPAGSILAILFFLGLSCAAISSLISMIEMVVRSVTDFGVNRSHAIVGGLYHISGFGDSFGDQSWLL